MFTQVRSADRRVAPVEGQNHKSVMKAVYVVLELSLIHISEPTRPY